MRIAGWATLWNEEDSQGDRFAYGAFVKIRDPLPMFYCHSEMNAVGKWSWRVDRKGLWVSGVILKTEVGKEVMTLVDGGVLLGLSVGYKITESSSKNGSRRITKSELMEVSIVASPMLEKARIVTVS